MAGGKNIEIKIAATGGDKASAEIRKLEAALGIVDKSEKQLAANRAMFMSAAEAEVAEVERLVTSTKKLDVAKTQLAAATNKVSEKAVTMKADWKNVGYQVQDVAVQVGAGTSAFRALGQQLPQLLSGFGPMGVTLGTVAAVALPLAGSLLAMGNAAEESGEKADEAAEKLKKLTDARLAKAMAAGIADNKDYLDSLDDEWEALNRNNQAMQRQIDLMQAKFRARVEVDNAKAALELAKIDASDMSDGEKIQARAKVTDRVERQKFRDDQFEARFRSNAANNQARDATGKATEKQDAVEGARSRLADQEAEAAALRGKIIAADQAKESLKAADDMVEKAKAARASVATRVSPETGEALYTPEQLEAEDAKVKNRQAERDRIAVAAGGASGADRERLKVLEGEDKKSGVIADTKKALDDLTAAAKSLAEAAEQARETARNVEKAEVIGIEGKFEATKARLEQNRVTANAGTVKAVKRDAKEYLDEQAADAGARRNDEAKKGQREGAAKAGRDAVALLPDGTRKEFADSVKAVSKRLQDGDQGGELAELAGLMRELASSTITKTSKIDGEVAEIRKQIGILTQRQRNG